MIPPLIVQEALDQDINLIAITDHNASANVIAVQKAAQGTDLTVLPGMELQTEEDVHSLCLFDSLGQLQTFQDYVNARMPPIKNNPDYFGEQFVVDESGDFLYREERLLIVSAAINLKEAQTMVTQLGGLFIPAHINRKAYGLFSHLGLLPLDTSLDALEISRHLSPQEATEQYPQISSLPLIQDGDVHFLSDFLGKNYFQMESATIAEIKLALHQSEGRSHRIK